MKQIFKTSLLGVGLSQIAVFIFVAMVVVVSLPGVAQLRDWKPARDALNLWPSLALAALVPGCLIGTVAGVIQRHRYLALTAAILLGYLMTALISTVLMLPDRESAEAVSVLALGAWTSLAYVWLAFPALLIVGFMLERWTRVSGLSA